jgi:hypothetical protein
MDAQEIQHVRRDQKQLVDLTRRPGPLEAIVEPLHVLRRPVGRHRLEPHDLGAVRVLFNNVVAG